MKIRTVWCVYYSATGTTEKIATRIAMAAAALLGAEYKVCSFSLPGERVRPLTFSEDDFVVLGIPVYAGRVPNLLLPFLKEKVCGNGTPATAVTLFGNRSYDDALIELRDIMQGSGFCCISAGAFVGEHSFSGILGAGRPDAGDMALARELGENTAVKLLKLTAPPVEAVPVKGNEPVRPYYTPRDRFGNQINILKVKPKTDKTKCVNCGLCSEICTMGSIDPANVSEIPGVCTKCCACVKRCPANAKYFDDEGYLYHKRELEEVYVRRAQAELFY